MFEREIQRTRLSSKELPPEIAKRFTELRGLITHRSLIPWAEHCSECAMPSCFQTCEFYSPRADFKCRRFSNGIEALPLADSAAPDLMKIQFRNWGKLEGRGVIEMAALSSADKEEARDERLAAVINGVPMPGDLRRKLIRSRYNRKLKRAEQASKNPAAAADAFVLECFNPGTASVGLTVTFRPVGDQSHRPYQSLWTVQPGFNRHLIRQAEIAAQIDLSTKHLFAIEPGEDQAKEPLYFGLLDFVRFTDIAKTMNAYDSLSTVNQTKDAPAPASAATSGTRKPLEKLKCIVWDLDNTLWKGTLVEDGIDKLELDQDKADLIKRLDERGVLHSVASKNDHENAMAALKKFGLDDYFLYPQISWGPKSLAVDTIVRSLNIGIDTFIFVDDQPFERAEVGEAHPDITVVEPWHLMEVIPDDVLNKVPTDESRRRREMYREESLRNDVLASSGGDYETFLKGCNLRLEISSLSPDNLRRVHELAQRTNQMNFSGNRYTQPELKDMMGDDSLETCVLRCSDRFGDYGIVGFGIFDKKAMMLNDLMFSCRIQSKRIEHAFIAHLLQKHSADDGSPLRVFYRRTDRNAPSARFFDDMGFELHQRDGDVEILEYPAAKAIPNDGIVDVKETDTAGKDLKSHA